MKTLGLRLMGQGYVWSIGMPLPAVPLTQIPGVGVQAS